LYLSFKALKTIYYFWDGISQHGRKKYTRQGDITMDMKKAYSLAAMFMLSTLCEASQQSVLAHHGIHVDAQAAAKLYERKDVAEKLALHGMPEGARNDLAGFITVHDSNPIHTPIPEIAAQHRAVQQLATLGIPSSSPQEAKALCDQNHVLDVFRTVVQPLGYSLSAFEYRDAHNAALPGTQPLDIVHGYLGQKALMALGITAPSHEEISASRHFAKARMLDTMGDLLPYALYLQQNPDGRLSAAILEPSLPQLRATKLLHQSGNASPADTEINMLAKLVGVDQTLSSDEIRETLRLTALKADLQPDRLQIEEGLRQIKLGLRAGLEDIAEGLRQKEMGITDPDSELLKEGIRLARDEGLPRCTPQDLRAALTLQNPGGAPIIQNPNAEQVHAMAYIIDMGLQKPDASFVNAVATLRNPAKLNMIRPDIKHVLGYLRLVDLKKINPTRFDVVAMAHLVNPDGLNESPKTLERLDPVIYLQNTLSIEAPAAAEIDAALYLMSPGWGAAILPLPKKEDIKATVYLRTQAIEGGLEIANPNGEDVAAVAQLQDKAGLNLPFPSQAEVIAAKFLKALPLPDFKADDLSATVDLQNGHGDVPATPRPDIKMINAAKCLLGHQQGGYTARDLEATKYLQTDPGKFLGTPSLKNPDWDQIQATVQLRRTSNRGLGIKKPTLAQINGMAYLQKRLGAAHPAYLIPSLAQLNAIVHLQGSLINKANPSEQEVRATMGLQAPAPAGGWGFGGGNVLDATPSLARIDAMVYLQDWQQPARHVGQPVPQPTLPQIDAVAKGDDHQERKRAIAIAIQEGFAGQSVGTLPLILGHLKDVQGGYHYFHLIPLTDIIAMPGGVAPLPVALEPVRDRLLNHTEGSHTQPGTTGFKIANAHLAHLNRLKGDGTLGKGEIVMSMGLIPDLHNPGAVIMVSSGNSAE
jgi:hypothetical protein